MLLNFFGLNQQRLCHTVTAFEPINLKMMQCETCEEKNLMVFSKMLDHV